MLTRDVRIKYIATSEEKTFRRYGLKLGFKTAFAEGDFYVQPPNDYYYYCDRIEGGAARLYLVESFQLGSLVQAEMLVLTQHANYFVPVRDEAILNRLRRRLARIKRQPPTAS